MNKYFLLFTACCLSFSLTESQGKQKAGPHDPFKHPFANPVDQPDLTRVLILGDSISIGYTPRVRRLLDGKANVHRPPLNCRWSAFGDENIEAWIGDADWDVIHFNWGLWDWYGWSQEVKATPESYAASLDRIVTKMKKTNAKLIFATTTPPCMGPEAKVKIVVSEERAKAFNDAARTVMKKHGVQINDLYAVMGDERAKYQRGVNNVHYIDEGRDLLAAAVAGVIGTALEMNQENIWVVAHRGASKQAPENTLPAFELAWEQGADAIEGDFRLTKDGQIVCIHDATTKRTCEKNIVVAQSTLNELRALDAGLWRGDAFKGTRIPTMAEVFATIPAGKKIFIELKAGVEIIPALIEALQQSELNTEQIVVICFDENALKKLKELAPQYKTSWLVNFKKKDAGGVKPTYDSVFETLSEISADGLSTSRHFVDAAFIQRVMDRGIEHHVWTVDDKATANRFKAWGTRSVTTNVPDDIRKALSDVPVKAL